MPRGIKGYRWIETGIRVWQLEHPSGQRRFLGCVSENTSGWTWWTRNDGHEQGECITMRQAKDEVERRMMRGVVNVPPKNLDDEIARIEAAMARYEAADDDEVDPEEYQSLLDRLVALRKQRDALPPAPPPPLLQSAPRPG